MSSKIFSTIDTSLLDRNGQSCEVMRPLTESEAELSECGPRCRIKFTDGFIIDVFGDELLEDKSC